MVVNGWREKPMPRQLRLSKSAQLDKDEIWLYTANTYNLEQADAYDKLLVQALRDIRTEPERPSSRKYPALGPEVRGYHISLSKKRSGARIRSPRHVVFYTLEFEDETIVLRILKDDMDARRHLAEGYL